MIKNLVFIGLALVLIVILFSIFQTVRGYFLPGIRRLSKKEATFKNTGGTIGERLDQWIQTSFVSPATYQKIELFLARNGQSIEWTVSKLIRNFIIALLAGIFIFAFLLLVFFSVPDANPLILVVAFLSLVLYPIFPILLFRSGRSDFLNKIILQTPEFLDQIEAELVRGTGNVEQVIYEAAINLEGELRFILKKAQRLLQLEPGNVDGACKLIQQHVAHPLYDQLILMITQYNVTGKAEKSLKSLQQSCRVAIEELHRSQTRQKTLLISVVAIGIVGNLSILLVVPMLDKMINFQFFM